MKKLFKDLLNAWNTRTYEEKESYVQRMNKLRDYTFPL